MTPRDKLEWKKGDIELTKKGHPAVGEDDGDLDELEKEIDEVTGGIENYEGEDD